MKINVEKKRERGRPKERWQDMNENDMRAIGICVGNVENQDRVDIQNKEADPK